MVTFPNCKINLGLHVVGRREDGYHELETIFLPVHDMCDELEIVEAESGKRREESSMEQEGIALDNPPEDNLCMKAWRMMHEEFGIAPVHIRLKKNIPFGAGLGGGSSDAAFTLKMLNEMFSIGLGEDELERRAVRLGADCAFFVRNRAAYATGIGEKLESIDWEVERERWKVMIEIPEGEHVSTREAYGGLKSERFGKPRPDLREAIKRPIEDWRELIVNDFEASVFPTHPAIAALKEEMYRRGALYASMTGSGAAVFGVFRK